jgi:recombination protein RecA
VEFVSTQSIGADLALGGGWAKGRIHEIYGPPSSGKTTMTLHAIAEVQQQGGRAAFIDMEHALELTYAANIGVNTEDLLVTQPECGEDAMEITERLVRTAAVDLIIIDSVSALTPRQEIEKEMGDSSMGKHAMLMSQAMRKLTGPCYRTGTTIIFINQIRMKIGLVFGNPETTTGGEALKFYASQRVDVRRKGGVKEGDKLVANLTEIKVVKNKVAPPFLSHKFNIIYGVGIDKYLDLLDVATEKGIIDKAGSWYAYQGNNIGQGQTKSAKYLQEHPEISEAIRKRLLK